MKSTADEQPRHDRSPFVLLGITIGKSAHSLLRGQLSWLREAGWRAELVTCPDKDARLASAREGVVYQPIAMPRQISPRTDLHEPGQRLSLVLRREVVSDLLLFMKRADLIPCVRWTSELADVAEKVCTHDLIGGD